MIYIGELCRYLLAVPETPEDRRHRLRVAVGNGLRPEIWSAFRERFGIENVREFYTATEAPGILLNRDGVEGSVGRPMPLFARLYKLARFDPELDEHPRDARGFCIPCDAGEPGELLIKISDPVVGPGHAISRLHGSSGLGRQDPHQRIRERGPLFSHRRSVAP